MCEASLLPVMSSSVQGHLVVFCEFAFIVSRAKRLKVLVVLNVSGDLKEIKKDARMNFLPRSLYLLWFRCVGNLCSVEMPMPVSFS